MPSALANACLLLAALVAAATTPLVVFVWLVLTR